MEMPKVNDIKHISDDGIVCLEGNGSRPSHKGCGFSDGGVMFTLNNTEVHAVCYVIYFTKIEDCGGCGNDRH